MTYADDRFAALAALRSHVLLVVPLAVERSLLLNEANINERTCAVGVSTHEAARAPRLVHG